MAEQKDPGAQGTAQPKTNSQANGGGEPQTQVLSEMDNLKARLQATEQQRDELRDLVKQTRAEFENYQKRAQRALAP